MNTVEDFIASKLNERETAGTLRTLKADNDLIDFCSNDYLGFARSIVLKSKTDLFLKQHQSYLNGATGSRLLSGNTNFCEELETEIALFHDAEAGLIFNSGYDANIGLFSSLAQRGDTIITDELIHASIIDGARLSYANRYTFKHNDLNSLEDKLKQAKGNIYIAVESIYSMDGDIAPLKEIIALAAPYNARVIVDEAHAVGVFNKGLVNELGLHNYVFARLVTFGKALGTHGAIILGSKLLRGYLINFARSFVYTTAAPFHQLASVKMAYELLTDSRSEQKALTDNIYLFKSQLSDNKSLINSTSAIQCVIISGNGQTSHLAKTIQNAGFDVRPILSPTVAAGTERLRICLHSFNTTEQITGLTGLINTHTNG
ncbi:8-amino-7-oxononanoate synthase [Mucilaginibacter sp. HMF5004]|uniref:aminotransferase class I/II-fold pyridoxal phosphate-dependent enzyme n=1 Tax=Mucilaginibacter rivuli TaxID=2857527 RepID=UPI001C5DDBB2|nr:8-amino-7-oxononanoate synthase [Mucilaginibacter rivuli]MBW4889527.1 8-amino-7-oxononanoate synthase [Mucilaginibacter rivuli]